MNRYFRATTFACGIYTLLVSYALLAVWTGNAAYDSTPFQLLFFSAYPASIAADSLASGQAQALAAWLAGCGQWSLLAMFVSRLQTPAAGPHDAGADSE